MGDAGRGPRVPTWREFKLTDWQLVSRWL